MGELLNHPNAYLRTILHDFIPEYRDPRDMWVRYEKIFQTEGMEAAYRWTSFLFSGDSPGELKERARGIWSSKLQSGELKVAVEILDLCHYLQKFNWEIYIITASPTLIIQAVANYFSIPTTNVIGMNLSIENDSVTPKIIEPFTFGAGKVRALDSKIKKRPTFAFGDSGNDEALLLHSHHGILLSRGNKELESRLEDKVTIQPGFS